MEQTLKTRLIDKPELRKHLFEKGFLITDAEIDASEDYPFFGNWKLYDAAPYRIFAYHSVPVYLENRDGTVFFLIGHAYDPFISGRYLRTSYLFCTTVPIKRIWI